MQRVRARSAQELQPRRRQISKTERAIRGALEETYIMSAIKEKLSTRALDTYACTPTCKLSTCTHCRTDLRRSCYCETVCNAIHPQWSCMSRHMYIKHSTSTHPYNLQSHALLRRMSNQTTVHVETRTYMSKLHRFPKLRQIRMQGMTS